MADDTSPCPLCHYEIKSGLRICRFCERDIGSSESETGPVLPVAFPSSLVRAKARLPVEKYLNHRLAAFLIDLVIIFAIITFLSQSYFIGHRGFFWKILFGLHMIGAGIAVRDLYSPGRKCMRLHLVSLKNPSRAAGFIARICRSLTLDVPLLAFSWLKARMWGLLFFNVLVESLMVLFTPHGSRLGDRFTGTVYTHNGSVSTGHAWLVIIGMVLVIGGYFWWLIALL